MLFSSLKVLRHQTRLTLLLAAFAFVPVGLVVGVGYYYLADALFSQAVAEVKSQNKMLRHKLVDGVDNAFDLLHMVERSSCVRSIVEMQSDGVAATVPAEQFGNVVTLFFCCAHRKEGLSSAPPD